DSFLNLRAVRRLATQPTARPLAASTPGRATHTTQAHRPRSDPRAADARTELRAPRQARAARGAPAMRHPDRRGLSLTAAQHRQAELSGGRRGHVPGLLGIRNPAGACETHPSAEWRTP